MKRVYLILIVLILAFGGLVSCGSRGKGRVFDSRAVRLIWRPSPGEPRPTSVFLSGSFNDWQIANPAFKCAWSSIEGGFVINLSLPPGRYEYKFVVDGRWLVDSEARETESDPLGGRLGVFYVNPTQTQ